MEALYGKVAIDANGEELGVVDAVYLDKGSGEPEWVAVRTGRSETSLAPLAGAGLSDAGVQLAVVAKLVRNAPHSDHPPGQVTPELTDAQEAELYLYYSVDYTSPSAETEVIEGEPSGAEAVGPEGPALGTS
ncbi:MAG TPA: PRC-barrel domain-containing protein [Acidimicrobiales bacterium]|nr:PRC-barrel domain-containing protein [Acidimicrobiales bacterium]